MHNQNPARSGDETLLNITGELPSALSDAIRLLEKGQYEDARHLLESFLQNCPDTITVPACWCLGWTHTLKGERDKAVPIFDRTTRLAPDRPESFLYLGEMYRSRGDLRGACEMWWRSLTLAWQHENPLIVQIAAAFLAAAQVSSDGTQEEIVRQHLVLVLKSPGWTDNTIHPSQIPFILSLVGCFVLRSRQYATAVSLLSGRIENGAGFSADTYHLACAQEHLGNRKAAAEAYRQTLLREPKHRRARKAIFLLELRRLNLVAAVYHFAVFCLGERQS